MDHFGQLNPSPDLKVLYLQNKEVNWSLPAETQVGPPSRSRLSRFAGIAVLDNLLQ